MGIIVGLKDPKLSESLQMDPEITFLKTVAKVHQHEGMDKQQSVLRGRMVERQCGINATMGKCQVRKKG